MRTLMILALAGAGLWGQFWEKKPVASWNDREVARLFHDSPWAAEVPARITEEGRRRLLSSPGMSRPPAGGPGIGGPLAGPQGGPGLNGPGGVGIGDPGRFRITVRWESAAPLREAIVQAKVGSLEGAEAFRMMEELGRHYLVVVENPPLMQVRAGANAGLDELLQGAATLERSGRVPLRPEGVEVKARGDGALVAYLRFPRKPEITPEDGEVEFVLMLATLEFRRKFKLAAMGYRGKLAL
jgi:hypothetical protein